MRLSTILYSALVASTPIYAADTQPPPAKPSEPPTLGTSISQGCYKSNANMTLVKLPNGPNGDVTGNTQGACTTQCKKENKGYTMLSLQTQNCYCGVVLPPKADITDDDNCLFNCPGYPFEPCGGVGKSGSNGFYSVYNMGIDLNPERYQPEQSSSSSAPSSSKTPSSSSSDTPGKTSAAGVTETSSPEESDKPSTEKKGPNTAGIAAGVVVGVVVAAAAIGGLVFFMRRKRNAEIEEEHRRNAAVNAFISGSKPPSSHGSISMTDSRLDPVLAHRRMSDGSIADNEDYSRRILRVTNA